MKIYKVEIDEDGTQFWYNEKGQRHREDGPAIVGKNGYQEWWVNGKCHREDGPAIVGKDYQAWWVNGEQLTEQEFNNIKNSLHGKIVEIDGKQYRLIEI